MGKNCVIVGGGIIGLFTAYYLFKDGHKVTILDKGGMNGGASFVNAGYITPSHIIPLSSPGIITKGLKWMLNNRSPFYVKPRLDNNFLKWAWSFKKSSTQSHVNRAIPILKDISFFSRELYEDLKRSQDFAFTYERNGLLMCFKTARGEEEEAKIADIASNEGMKIRHISAKELNEQFPKANYKVKGAFFYDTDAHMTPDEFMKQMRAFLEANGVRIIKNASVSDFEVSGNRLTAVKTREKSFQADEVILASGTWTPEMARKLNLSVSIEAGKGYSFNIYRDIGVVLPSVLTEAKVAVTPMNGFTRFAGTMELGGINDVINPIRVEAIADAAENHFNDLKITSEEKIGARAGLRPCSPDGLPYIGRSRKWKNLSIGAGHSMIGWSLGPATGKLISEVIACKKPSIALEPFSPDRKF
ncbi:FAD-dependent oxidoreductase [Gramella sp. BOM4]|nr:FAD-dependent oxidoreductase [Christiangramia bathymodioli]